MTTRIFLFSALLFAAAPVWPQTNDASATATDADPAQMLMPPPISAVGFPTAVGAEERSNYLSGGLTFNGGYLANLYPGTGNSTINDELYVVAPTISADHSTDRSHETFTYSPSFVFYQPNNTPNTTNHSGVATFQYRLSPHVTLLAGDSVAKTSDTWSQPLSSGLVSGGLPSVTPGIVVPFAPQISNNAYAQVGWQLSMNDMVGGGGDASLLNYSQSSPESSGLYNSNSRGASAFYTHRLTDRQYIGASYQFSDIVATPAVASGVANADLDANGILGFYTVYPKPTLSLSLGGGSQRYKLTQSPTAPAEGWAPSAFGSLGWQGLHTSLAASCSRLVTEGEGIIGVHSNTSATLSGRWQISRNWTTSVGGAYSDFATLAQSSAGSVEGGHTLSGTASVGRRVGKNLSFAIQYQRLHESYPEIATISLDPNSSNASASITFHFSTPLSR
jgi:hypothetical protein